MGNGYEHALFMQKAKPGKMEEYIKVHKKVWPELLKAIKESGIEREFVWVHGDFIYVYMMSKNFEKSNAENFSLFCRIFSPILAPPSILRSV